MPARVPTSTTQSSALTGRPAPAPRARRSPAPARRGRARRAGPSAPERRTDSARSPPARPQPPCVDQVGEQPERARHAGGELPEERQPGVDEGALARLRDQHRALQRLLARVVHRQRRGVARVPRLGEVEPALLHPAGEVVGADAVRARRAPGAPTASTAAFSSVTRPWPMLKGKGPRSGGAWRCQLLVLYCTTSVPPGVDVLHQLAVERRQLRLDVEGAHAEHDGVEAAERAARAGRPPRAA